MESTVLTLGTPVPFGYKMGWLAIHAADRDAVVRSLQLADPAEVTWAAGIDAVYADAYQAARPASRVFVSPPVCGWIFVVGAWAMGDGAEPGLHEVEQQVARLSAEFGEAQAFATYRVVDYHHWMLARYGTLVRSFAVSDGAPLADFGLPTPVERRFRWYPLDADEDEDEATADAATEEGEQDAWPDEEAVMTVAGEWSVNPQLLGPGVPAEEHGILATAPAALDPARAPRPAARHRPWWRFWR